MSSRAVPHPIEAVVFDMDGVLIDSEPFWREVEVEVFGPLGLDLTPAMLASTMGMRTEEVAQHWYRHRPWDGPSPAEVAARLVARVVETVRRRGAIAEGAREAVDYLEGLGLRLALASSSPRVMIEAVLEVCGLLGRFEVVHSAQDERLGKPNPSVYLTTARELGVRPERCLAIEDSPAGVRAAKAAGMACLAVPAPGAEDAVAAGGADLVLGSLTDLGDRMWTAAGLVPIVG